MKLNDIFKSNDGYVIAQITMRDSDGTPRDIEPKSCCMTFEEAVRERESLSGMDYLPAVWAWRYISCRDSRLFSRIFWDKC